MDASFDQRIVSVEQMIPTPRIISMRRPVPVEFDSETRIREFHPTSGTANVKSLGYFRPERRCIDVFPSPTLESK